MKRLSKQLLDYANKQFHNQTNLQVNVITLMLATIVSQAIPLILTPFFTRVFKVEDFGVYLLFSSTVSIVVTLASSYQSAIMLPDNDEEAFELLILSIAQGALLSFVFFVLYQIILYDSSLLEQVAPVQCWLPYVPIQVFFANLYQACYAWLNRKSNFKTMAYSKCWQSMGVAVITLFFSLANANSLGLIFGSIGGTVISTLFVLGKVSCNTWKLFSCLSFQSIKRVVFNYKDFFINGTLAGFLNNISYQISPILIGFFFGELILGLYSLTIRVLNLPITLLGSAISEALYPKAVENDKGGILYGLIYTTGKKLLNLIIGPFILLILFGPSVFSFIFGSNWAFSGTIAQLMAIFYGVRFVISPLSIVITIKRKLAFNCYFNGVFVITQVLSLVLGYTMFKSSLASFALMSFFGFLAFSFYGFYINKLIRGS